jgi:hypothetical protein
MNIKELVLKVNDVLCYIIFAIICITAAIVGLTSNPFYGAAFGIGGLILFSLMSGYWFAVSSIASNTARQVVLQEKNNALLGKIYKELQENRNNPFDML